ncbi:LuxR family transcriptional regulator [Streptomyces sp. BPTC-684]|uniref:helix-turn-helix transcriptional regulator n=1 Tax=Streptomyces sp. BPTC-684 TaxID=3043734 RepID=UPI0024B0818B|nr:LuxR family transcriptional regulator [Streptomyces sp. BPTC-684]WHM40850.1 AAA family ATPase [Streptomyces sp. BPTC-684]
METTWGGRLPFVGRAAELAALHRLPRSPTCKAAVITGPPGVGKSRLAGEFLAGIGRRSGSGAIRVQATHSARSLPLSALTPLLPPDAHATDPADFFHDVRRRMAARRTALGRPTVLVVDDFHLLDPTSLALISLLLADATLFVAATLPDGAEWPDVLRSLWREDALHHTALTTLNAQESAALLSAAVGGPVAAYTAHVLWKTAQGNPLVLRELLRAALSDGHLHRVHGVWCLRQPLAAPLHGIPFDDRLAALPPDRRSLLELLALCGAIGLRDGFAHASPAVLADLEEQQLIVSHLDGRREQLSLAHPLHAQSLRSSVTRLRARALLLEQAARVRDHGARRSGDALALARWELDATGTADPALLVRAAAQAMYVDDVDSMCRLARAALAHGPNVRAGLMLGEALGQRGEFTEGLAVLEDTFATADGTQLASAALTLAVHHFYGPGNLSRALAVLDEAVLRGGPSPALDGWRATLLTSAGRIAAARTVLDAWPPVPPDAPLTPADVLLLQGRLRVQLASGRAEEAVGTGWAAHTAHRALAERTAVFYPARSLYLIAWALLEAGHLDEAEQVAQEGFDDLLRSPVPALVVWFNWIRGRIALDRGRTLEAARHFREARAQAHLCGHRYAEQRAVAGIVLAEAYAGRVDPEAVALASLAAEPGTPLRQADTLRAHAWVLRCQGRPTEAADVLRTASEEALAQGEVSAAIALRHDLLRWGEHSAAAGLLALAGQAQGPYAAARAAQAQALVRRDPEALSAVADIWAAMGAPLLAAESLAQAGHLWRTAGGSTALRAAHRVTARAFSFLQECEEPATPLLAHLSPAADLTPREREMALLAAQGRTSKEIAAQCGVSVRTVDNTLGRAYRKLGISDRSGLQGVFTRRNATP